MFTRPDLMIHIHNGTQTGCFTCAGTAGNDRDAIPKISNSFCLFRRKNHRIFFLPFKECFLNFFLLCRLFIGKLGNFTCHITLCDEVVLVVVILPLLDNIKCCRCLVNCFRQLGFIHIRCQFSHLCQHGTQLGAHITCLTASSLLGFFRSRSKTTL